jgi:hypothetical protein
MVMVMVNVSVVVIASAKVALSSDPPLISGRHCALGA